MIDLIIIAVVLVIIAAAITYIVKAKKSGVKCIGCSSSKQCSHNCDGGCNGCSGCHDDK